MSAEDFLVLAIEIPNPEFYPPSLPAQELNTSDGFNQDWSNYINTLSSNNPENWDAIKGLLYVPDLSSTDLCDNHTRSLIPHNATRYSDLPPDGWTAISVAPWTTPECVESFLSEIRGNPAAIAAIFYLPDGSSSPPQDPNSPSWNIGDGGKWRSNPFPIYAISGAIGADLMHQLALYSGNMTDVPHGSQLVNTYDSRNYIRLYTSIDVNDSTNIPSLWEFLIIVLCILLAVVVFTSLIMHLFQGRRRRSLQRRVARGEVDLEALGIKRLNVPQNILDKMPMYLYTAAGGGSAAQSSTTSSTNTKSKSTVRAVAFSQPTCPICLDDFVHNETMVRELPCSHIFHPECIDPFLRDNSSLCPMCKKSTLPAGYCPVVVTNLMVRRERLIRRMRERLPAEQETDMVPARRLSRAVSSWNNRRRQGGTASTSHRTQSVPSGGQEPDQSPGDSTEMTAMPAPMHTAAEDHVHEPSTIVPEMTSADVVGVPLEPPPAEIQAQGTSARRAWRRERIARQQSQSFAETARVVEDTRPKWRRVVGRVLPVLD